MIVKLLELSEIDDTIINPKLIYHSEIIAREEVYFNYTVFRIFGQEGNSWLVLVGRNEVFEADAADVQWSLGLIQSVGLKDYCGDDYWQSDMEIHNE